jgi:DNA-binding LacI/PurR family transcriptional regulator
MVRHLHDSGRRTIATIAGPPDTTCGIQRLAGWRDTLGRQARRRLIAHGDYTCAGGQAAMAQLLRTAPDLDAVFVASDLMAAGALAVLRRSGRKVPDDVAVGGFEDSAVATTVEPALTTVRRPLPRMSAEMVRLLLELIEGKPASSTTLPTDLIIRDST